MGISYDKNHQLFTLNTKESSYQMKVDAYGFLLHLYYGKKICGSAEYLLTYTDRSFSGNPNDVGADRTYSMDVLPQEYPSRLTGDYRSPAIDTRNADHSAGCDLRYGGHVICEGKYSLADLPAVYADKTEAETLDILMEDKTAGLEVHLLYSVLPEFDIITRSVRVINRGEEQIVLEKLQSCCLDFMTGKYDLITFYGRHAMERIYQRTPVSHGSYAMGSRRGTSSHQYNPMMILAQPQCTEEEGSCYGMSLVYSGSFKGEVEKDQYDQTRIQLGLQDELFSYPLNPGQMFTAPEVVLSYSAHGLGQLSYNLHRCFRTHLCRGQYRDVIRPVLLNSWEASYFDFTGESIYQLAKSASELGIEMLVMDDGWFGKRDDDNSGLGDWYVNEHKLGGKLADLVDKINALGMKFGIWIEPEMVNEDSAFYRRHPDWVMHIPGRKPVRGRNQLLLDFSRREVVDAVFEQICNVLDQANIEYVKWDMNRSMADVYSLKDKDFGKVQYDYICGVYRFMERLIQRYPNMLLEGCSGGGGRFDAGMLYYTPQIWCSDNTDAMDRIRIQYGTSFGYPISAVGSHVSIVPNHQTGRRTPLKTRSIVAMAGTFGYELNLEKLSADEKREIKKQILEYKKYGNLIQKGRYYRLSNPYEDNIGAWAFVSEDQQETLINAVRMDMHGNMLVAYVRLQGLRKHTFYRDSRTGKRYSSDLLMEIGMPLPVETGEYLSYQIYLQMDEDDQES